jgi:arylformamidase
LASQVIDFFIAEVSSAPLFIFIYGGYWQRNSKAMFSFVAPGLIANGFNVAVVGYTLAPQAGLADISLEIIQATNYLFQNNESLGFEPKRIYIGAGQLVAILPH